MTTQEKMNLVLTLRFFHHCIQFQNSKIDNNFKELEGELEVSLIII